MPGVYLHVLVACNNVTKFFFFFSLVEKKGIFSQKVFLISFVHMCIHAQFTMHTNVI